MATKKINLSRDQLASFLKNQEQIKQFEKVFQIVDEVAPNSDTTSIAIQAANAEQKAIEALNVIESLKTQLDTLPAKELHSSIVTDYIDIDANAAHVSQERRIQWNIDDGTIDVGLYGDKLLKVGEELFHYAKNTSGALIPKGTPVMLTGAVGASTKITFGLAVADGSVSSYDMLGVTAQDVANNAFGYVTYFGVVRGFNCSGSPYGETWNDGDLLYFGTASPGTWTKTRPIAPKIAVPVAIVVHNGSGSSGSILVRMENSETLNNLQDVYISGSTLAGQVLIRDETNKRWVNNRLTAGSNVTITNTDGAVTINASSQVGTVTTWTPTVTASSGTITSYTLNGANYVRNGSVVHVNVDLTITNAGTGSGSLDVTLPFNNGSVIANGTGRENALTGYQLQCRVAASSGTMNIQTYSNTTTIATNAEIRVSMTYFV